MELLEQVESYLARTRISPSKFGRMALGDPRFVDDLRAGRKLRRKTLERVRCYLTQAQSGVT
jgi:2,4-dienoyl-CoA reductase-like NADH-dependent reductase (Old Yellow Enzyme family)